MRSLTDFDVIIVGSGPAGVSVAFPLVESGLNVLMIDGGKKGSELAPEADYLVARGNDSSQWKWLIGEDFHALKNLDAVSPKLRVPGHGYAFEDFGNSNQIIGKEFITLGSLAVGGLSNAWGCGVARFTPIELADFPFSPAELSASYATVSKRIGISGKINDDLSDYFGIDQYAQAPLPMDVLHTDLSKQYLLHRAKLNKNGFKLGRSRVAVLSEDFGYRKACSLSGNCLWGCSRRSLYSAADDLIALRKYRNFSEFSGFIVNDLVRTANYWSVRGETTHVKEPRTFTARKIVMAAGTLATSRIVLKSLNHRQSVQLLSCPTAAFLIWLPRRLGTSRTNTFGLGQLSFSLALQGGFSAFGSTFSTTGILISEFVRHVPLRRRFSIDLMRALLSSCVVGNLFLPGNLTMANARLQSDDSLLVSGVYADVVQKLMLEANRKLLRAYLNLGALLLPGSFTVGKPGADIHYSGTIPMRHSPVIGESTCDAEVFGLEGVYLADGSSLPGLPEKSHTLTMMANADRIGQLIATNFFK